MMNTINCFHLNQSDIIDVPEYLRSVYIANCVINAVFAAVAIVGNTAILVAMKRNPSLHTPGNVLIACLALSDLAVGLVAQPSYIPYKMAEIEKKFNHFCQLRYLYNLGGFLFSVLSCLIVTTISVDRFLALYLHLRYTHVVTVRRAMICFLVCLAFAVTLTTLLIWFTIVFLISAIVIIVCLMLTFSCSCCLLKWLAHHHRQINVLHPLSMRKKNKDNPGKADEQNMKFRKSVFTITCVVGLMFVFYLPYFAAFLYRMKIGYPTPPVRFAHNLTEMIAFMNSACNPVLYCWNIREIRKPVLKLLRCKYE